MAMILITHDLGVVAMVCSRVMVMYSGKIVEEARVKDLFTRALHPYTRGLLWSLPCMDGSRELLATIPGQPEVRYEGARGCPFENRCNEKMAKCVIEFPNYREVGEEHHVACWAV